jgi:hypothetical protein
MTDPIRQDINYTRCNAYSAMTHLYSAISVEGRQVIDTNRIGMPVDQEVSDDPKGGIIVFPQEVIDIQLSEYKDLSWSLGRFFKGRYTDKNGKVYSDDSLCLEITGITEASLIEIAEELCKTLNQESALIKSNSERNRILLVDESNN